MFYKPDRSGSITVTFSMYMTLVCSSGHLGSSSVFVLGHRIKCGLAFLSGAWRLGVKSWSETLNTENYLSKL